MSSFLTLRRFHRDPAIAMSRKALSGSNMVPSSASGSMEGIDPFESVNTAIVGFRAAAASIALTGFGAAFGFFRAPLMTALASITGASLTGSAPAGLLLALRRAEAANSVGKPVKKA